MSQLLTAKPPQLGTLSQYSDPATSSSSVLSHGSSLFDKITPTSTASDGESPPPSPFEEKELANVVTMEVDLSADVPVSPFDSDFEMSATEAGDGEVYSSDMPLIEYAPDDSVDIDAITPDTMGMVMRLQDLGCQLDAATILNKIASAKAAAKMAERTGAGYDGQGLGSEPPWLAFVETVFPGVNVRKAYLDSSSALLPPTPPPAPRLQPTQLPDDDIPEMSLFDLLPDMEAQISEFAASLKTAASSRAASAPSRGVQVVATPASMLFGGMPEPVSMRVPMSAFGYSGGSPRGFATPNQSEQTPVPRAREYVGSEGVKSGESPGFRLDMSTPELQQAFHDGFAASNSLLDMALQLEAGGGAFCSSPVRNTLKMEMQSSPSWDFPSLHSSASAGHSSPVRNATKMGMQPSPGWAFPSHASAGHHATPGHSWETPSKPPLGPMFPLHLGNAFSTPPANKPPVSYSHSSSVTITTTENHSQIVQSCSTVSLLQHSPSQSSIHRPSTAQVPLQTLSLSQPHLASHSSSPSSSPKGTQMTLGNGVHMSATAEFDGVVEEICELLVSEKMPGNVQLYLETLTYQLENMLRESRAVLMQEVRQSRAERSCGGISRRGALRKPSRRARRDPSDAFPRTPPPAVRAGSPSSFQSSSPSVLRWSPPSSSTSSTSLGQDAQCYGSPTSAPSSPRKGLASFLSSVGPRERL